LIPDALPAHRLPLQCACPGEVLDVARAMSTKLGGNPSLTRFARLPDVQFGCTPRPTVAIG